MNSGELPISHGENALSAPMGCFSAQEGVSNVRGVFGVISLLIVLVVVGIVAVKQLKAMRVVPATPGGASVSAEPAPGTVREQSQRLQDKVRSDVVKALEQGARKEEPAQ
jgi:hypothetical protein